MRGWSSTKSRLVLAALKRIGWRVVRQDGSHRFLERPGWKAALFSFHDGDEIGPTMLKLIAKETGLKPEDL